VDRKPNNTLIVVILVVLAVVIGVIVGDQGWINRTRQLGQQNQERHIAGFPLTITDSLKRSVTVERKPRTIVSIAPSATEILFAIGAGDRVVADTTYCDSPPAAAKLPKIGGYINPDVEKILSLSPDLVLGARGTPTAMFNQLQSLKLTVAAIDEEDSIDQVFDSIRLIGQVVGENQHAAALVGKLKQRRAAVVARTAKLTAEQRPRVLFVFTPGDLYSAGKGSFIDEIIRLGGGVNIAAKTNSPWPQLSMETVVADDPQVILVLNGSMGGKQQPLTSAAALARFRALPRWAAISAVKNGRVYALDDDALTLPGPRLIDGLEAAAQAIHPELFKGDQ